MFYRRFQWLFACHWCMQAVSRVSIEQYIVYTGTYVRACRVIFGMLDGPVRLASLNAVIKTNIFELLTLESQRSHKHARSKTNSIWEAWKYILQDKNSIWMAILLQFNCKQGNFSQMMKLNKHPLQQSL